MRLIDADTIFNNKLLIVREDCYDAMHSIVEMINNAPVVDAVPVVRCKGCKYYFNSNEQCGLFNTRLRFYETDKSWSVNSFCSWGERREDDR